MAGLTTNGFVTKQQAQIITEMQNDIRTAFGQSVNLQPESVFGQFVGIVSGQLAEIWQLDEAIYDSQYPSGAEGTSVDNILALNNMKRLPASPTVTAPVTNGTPGLVCYGTAATIIPAGSLVSVFGQPTFQFSIDFDITILAAVDAIQNIFFTSVPDSGAWKITLGGHLSSSLAYNISAANLQIALRLLTGYSDVTVSGSFTIGFTINFLGTSGGQPQALAVISNNTLLTGSTSVNTNVVEAQAGAVAQGAGSATATQNGPLPAPANTITVIDTPVSGWTSVNNPLDALPGSNLETDTEAMVRRASLLQAQGNGPIQAIVQKVRLLPGVEQAVGFENLYLAAQQLLNYSSVPTSGSYKLVLNGNATATINYNATAANIQTAIRGLSGYPDVLVTGDAQFGFTIDFNGSMGGQPQPLFGSINNTLSDGGAVTVDLAFGLPGKAFQVVVLGGEDIAIANSIFNSKPAGIETFGSVSEVVTDDAGNVYTINFSRPDEISVYITITLDVDQDTFPPDGVSQIQQELIAIGNAIPIGGTIIGFGTNGLIGAFNNILGILSYDMQFGLSPSPSTDTNIPLLSKQRALFESFNILVTVNYV